MKIMARPLRIEYEGAFYHVAARGNARKDIFKNACDREREYRRPVAAFAKWWRAIEHWRRKSKRYPKDWGCQMCRPDPGGCSRGDE